MKANYQAIRNGLVALAIAMAAQDASATAIASVERNILTLVPTIEGIALSIDFQGDSQTKTEFGNASVNFTGPIVTIAPDGSRLSVEIGGTAIADPGYALGVETLDLTIAFTNLTGADLDIVRIAAFVGTFNPGGPSVGARVDDSTLEFARFLSTQSSLFLSESGVPIGGISQCDTRIPDPSFPSPPPSAECGVVSPDETLFFFTISNLRHNEPGVAGTFSLSLELEALSSIGVPEPGALALLSASLLGLVGFRFFRKNA